MDGAQPSKSSEKSKKKKPFKKKKHPQKRVVSGAPAAAAAAAAAAPAPPPADLTSSGGHTLSDRLNPTHPGFDAALKARWKAMTKKERAAYTTADAELLRARAAAVSDITHPFPVEDEDHAETSPEAYADAAPVLDLIARRLGKDRGGLVIYDPYFCAGAVKRHMGALGFPNVTNQCEDFYERARRGLPEHDVLLTNPAYSGDHIPRLLDICCSSGKPFLLLMPNWVAAKDYYWAAQRRYDVLREALYWWPKKRYVYWTPQGFRSKKQAHASAAGNRTSPFPSFWYLGLGPHREAAVKALSRLQGGPACRLSFTVEELPAGVRPEVVRGSGGGSGAAPVKARGGSGGGGAAGKMKDKGARQQEQQQEQQHEQQPKKRCERQLLEQQRQKKARAR